MIPRRHLESFLCSFYWMSQYTVLLLFTDDAKCKTCCGEVIEMGKMLCGNNNIKTSMHVHALE